MAASKGKEGDALANAIHENDAEVADKIRKQAHSVSSPLRFEWSRAIMISTSGKVEWSAR